MSWTLIPHSIPSTCSPEQEAEYLATCSSDIALLAQSKSKHIPEKFCWQGSLTDAYLDSLFGTMLPPSEVTTPIAPASLSDAGVLGITYASPGDSRAKTLVAPEAETGLMESGADCGANMREYFAKLDRDSLSWKTPQCSLLGGLIPFSDNWPRWGMMRDGECFHAPMSAGLTYDKEPGLRLPTIGANEGKGSAKNRFLGSPDFRGAKMSEGLRNCEQDPIYLNPSFAELTMMWPLEWTDLKPLATAKFQQWLNSHGKPSQPK